MWAMTQITSRRLAYAAVACVAVMLALHGNNEPRRAVHGM